MVASSQALGGEADLYQELCNLAGSYESGCYPEMLLLFGCKQNHSLIEKMVTMKKKTKDFYIFSG